MYDDCCEIINPGILHFDMTPEKLSRPHESKPWNPIIASVFYRTGVIEKWGTGTLSIIEWCEENGNPKPAWEVRAQSVVTIFFPSFFFSNGKRLDEQTEELKRPELELKRPELELKRPESKPLEEEVLNLLRKGPLSKAEISHSLGHKHISGGFKKVLTSLLNEGKIAYTVPEKPNSRLQRYRLTLS